MGISYLNTVKASVIGTPDQNDLAFLDLSGRQKLYNEGYYGKGVIWGVLDTGTFPHAEIVSNIIDGRNACWNYSDKSDYSDDDENSHGTHVCGTICGRTVGIAPLTKIIPVKVICPIGGDVQDLINALYWCKDWRGPNGERMDGINMSLTVGETPYTAELEAAINAVVESGIAVICAAGNSGDGRPLYPAHFQAPIVVGSVSKDFKKSYFSSTHSGLDFCQIGENVISCSKDGGYISLSGTSMATPIVSGIAALIISKYKAEHNGEYMPETLLYEELLKNCFDMNVAGRDYETGYGFCTLEPGRYWAYDAYNFLNQNGVLVNEARFDDYITRGEVFVMLARMKGYTK